MSVDIPKADVIYVDLYSPGAFDGGLNVGEIVDEGDQPLRHSDGWRATCQVNDAIGGTPIFTLAESGTNGTITFDEWGHLFAYIPASFVATLTPTSDASGVNNRHHVGQILVFNTANPSNPRKVPAFLRVRVYPEVTA